MKHPPWRVCFVLGRCDFCNVLCHAMWRGLSRVSHLSFSASTGLREGAGLRKPLCQHLHLKPAVCHHSWNVLCTAVFSSTLQACRFPAVLSPHQRCFPDPGSCPPGLGNGLCPDFLPAFCCLSLAASWLLTESFAAGRCGSSHRQQISTLQNTFCCQDGQQDWDRKGVFFLLHSRGMHHCTSGQWRVGFLSLSSFVRSLLKLWKQRWGVSVLPEAHAVLRGAVNLQKGEFFSGGCIRAELSGLDRSLNPTVCFQPFLG